MSEEATAIKKQAGDPQRQSGGCIQSLLQVAQIDTEGGRNQTHFQPLGKLFGHPKCHVNELISAQEISVCDDDSVEPSCECLGSRLALQLAGSGLISRRERARERAGDWQRVTHRHSGSKNRVTDRMGRKFGPVREQSNAVVCGGLIGEMM